MDDHGRKAARRRTSRARPDVHLTKYEQLWEERFLQLREFIEEQGHSYVPSTRSALNGCELLGRWVETQRRFRKTGQLRQDRRQRLDRIGFDWEPLESAWIEMLTRCRAFRARHGHLAIPVELDEAPELAAWAADKRARYGKGSLEQRHIARLEKLGFCWDLQLRVWHQNFEQYRGIWKKAGGQPTPEEVGPKLLLWLKSMRHYHERLGPEQQELLKSVNFVWNPRGELWEEKFSALARHEQRSESSGSKAPDEVPDRLRAWMATQRGSRRQGTLSPEREAKLDAIGFDWDPLQELREEWESRFRELQAFRKVHGHVRVPSRGSALGRWVKTQRAFYKTGRLSEERIARLKSLGFVWEAAPRRKR